MNNTTFKKQEMTDMIHKNKFYEMKQEYVQKESEV